MSSHWMSSEQAAAALGVRLSTLYAYVSRGVIARQVASVPGGRRVSRFRRDEVLALARARERPRAGTWAPLIESDVTRLDGAGRLAFRGVDVEKCAGWGFERTACHVLGLPDGAWGGDGGTAVLDAVVPEGSPVPGAHRLPAAPPPTGAGRATDVIRSTVLRLAASDAHRERIDPAHCRAVAVTAVTVSTEALTGLRAGTVAERLALAWTSDAGTAAGTADAPDAASGADSDRASRAASGPVSGPASGPVSGPASGTQEGSDSGIGSPDDCDSHDGPHGRHDRRPAPTSAPLTAALDVALSVLVDHELTASTLAARAAAGVRADPWMVLLTGLAAMSGPHQAGAARRAAAALRAWDATGTAPADPVPGFGHAVYTGPDPRAVLLLDRVAAVRPATADLVDGLALHMARAHGLHPNVDLALGALTLAAGLPEDAGEVLFTLARVPGLMAHALEEYPLGLRLRPRALS
ncbi:citrate synthase [Streptomyces sp. NPDC056600]|uniref:citrate synthase n=1 Tax=Streptomyces sp. NPDC056600 TaxID=3345874 RepID=UPI0036979D9A